MAHLRYGFLLLLTMATCIGVVSMPAIAQTPVAFPGTVLKVDAAAGKLAVKKDGTRFTFVIDGKTRFEGGAKSLTDVKAGDAVTVTYLLMGNQYVAQNIAKK
ncbi:MAG: hypothetical protein ACKOBZ_08900 [Nitrospira sp.]|nr:hypothetical protein [Nitrospira sp.]